MLLRGLSATEGVHLPWVVADRVARYVHTGCGLWEPATAPRLPQTLF